MPSLMKVVEDLQIREYPYFEVGSTVQVNYRVIEGDKERIQPYVGVVIRKHCGEKNIKATFTVRKISQGYGVERTFPLHSPKIDSIEVVKVGKIHKARLYYLRDRSGKSARIKENLAATKSEV